MSKPIYTAIFLTEEAKEALLRAFPPLHPKVAGHHVTLVFKPGPPLPDLPKHHQDVLLWGDF